MKIPNLPSLPANLCRLYPDNTPRPFLIDRRFRRKIRRYTWKFIDKTCRARAVFRKEGTRKYLHRFVVELSGRYFPEITFADGNPFNCSLLNLKPYRREEEGAQRGKFRNNHSGYRGVYFKKTDRTWYACLKYKKKLYHLGYFDTALQAANAYACAWNEAHPTLPPLPVSGRTNPH